VDPALIITGLAGAVAAMAGVIFRELKSDKHKLEQALDVLRATHREERDAWRQAVLDHLNRERPA